MTLLDFVTRYSTKPMPRTAPTRSTRSRSRKAIASAPESFTHLPVDEKRALIDAHARERKLHPPGNVFGMYLGVAVCAMVVMVGWAIALPRTLAANDRSNSDQAIEAVVENGSAFGATFSGDKQRIENAAETLIESLKQQSEAAKSAEGGSVGN
jgi:hypothetical protein